MSLKPLNNNVEVDNRGVVPCVPLLSKTCNAHFNDVFCNSVKSIKHICKCINKRSDKAVFGVGNATAPIYKIDHYQLGHYTSRNETLWRVLAFSINAPHPIVVFLAVHLENGERGYFKRGNVRDVALSPLPATLTAVFLLCGDDMFSNMLLNSEVPTYYTRNALA